MVDTINRYHQYFFGYINYWYLLLVLILSIYLLKVGVLEDTQGIGPRTATTPGSWSGRTSKRASAMQAPWPQQVTLVNIRKPSPGCGWLYDVAWHIYIYIKIWYDMIWEYWECRIPLLEVIYTEIWWPTKWLMIQQCCALWIPHWWSDSFSKSDLRPRLLCKLLDCPLGVAVQTRRCELGACQGQGLHRTGQDPQVHFSSLDTAREQQSKRIKHDTNKEPCLLVPHNHPPLHQALCMCPDSLRNHKGASSSQQEASIKSLTQPFHMCHQWDTNLSTSQGAYQNTGGDWWRSNLPKSSGNKKQHINSAKVALTTGHDPKSFRQGSFHPVGSWSEWLHLLARRMTKSIKIPSHHYNIQSLSIIHHHCQQSMGQ